MKHTVLDAAAGMSRRQVLGFAGAAVLSACGGGNGGSGPSASTGGTGGAGGGTSGASTGRISVVAGSATGTGAVEQAIGQMSRMAFDPATGALVVNKQGTVVRYPVRGSSVDMGAGVESRYLPAESTMTGDVGSAHSTVIGFAVDPTGHAYCSVWYVDDWNFDTYYYRHGDVCQVSPTGQVVSLMAEVGAGTPVLPDRLALLPDGTLAFFDILSGWLMRWQVGKGLTRLVQLVPGNPQGGNNFGFPIPIDLVSAPTGVYVLQRMERTGQNGASEVFVRVSLWNWMALTFIADIALPAGSSRYSGIYAANNGQVVFAVGSVDGTPGSVDVVQNNGGRPWMVVLQPNGQVRPLDVSTLEGGSAPEVTGKRVWYSMAFAPDGALWVANSGVPSTAVFVEDEMKKGKALLRIELPS